MATIDLYEAMRTLRAVRRLRPDPIPDDVLYRVLEAASWAPTGGNRQAWRIIVVKDAARKQRLGELYKKITIPYTQSYVKQFADRPEEERTKAERVLRASTYLAEHFGESPVLLVVCFNPEGLAVTDAKLDRCVGGRRRFDLHRSREPAAGLPGRGAGLCADHPAVHGGACGARTAGHPRSVGHRRRGAGRLSGAARSRPDLAPTG